MKPTAATTDALTYQELEHLHELLHVADRVLHNAENADQLRVVAGFLSMTTFRLLGVLAEQTKAGAA